MRYALPLPYLKHPNAKIVITNYRAYSLIETIFLSAADYKYGSLFILMVNAVGTALYKRV